MVVRPAPPDLRRIPALTNRGGGATPSLMPKSDWKSQVPLRWSTAPWASVSVFALVQAVFPTGRVRWFMALMFVPVIERSPCTASGPVPAIVPPDQVMGPVTVTLSEPSSVPFDWEMDGTVIDSPLLRVRPPA